MRSFLNGLLRAGLAVGLLIGGISAASAQCSGQFPANTFCGNNTGSTALPGPKTLTPGSLQPIAGGTVIGNPTGATAVPVATATPVLGIPGAVQGSLGFAGVTSGTALLRAQAAAGTPTLLLPTTSGTLPSTATAPLALDATTGALSITGLDGGVLAGSAPAFTATPVLGASGTLGSIGFGNATSGIVTLQTVTGALGTPTVLLPNASGTVAVSASSPLVLGALTGALTCPTCVTSSGGGAITGTAPINVSAAGVVSLTTPLALQYGGTAANLTAANGGVVYSTATAMAILAPTATARQMLQSGASAAPAWSTSTWPATTTANRLLYSSAANTVGEITTVAGGMVNASGAGVPSFTVTPTLGVAGASTGTLTLAGVTSGGVTIQPQSAAGTYNFNLPTTAGTSGQPLLSGGGAGSPMTFGTLGLAAGGTSASLTASNGGLVYSTASALAILSGTATANQIPLSGSNAAPSWSTATYPGTAAAGTVLAAATANTIAATPTPTLGVNGGTGGQITLNGATSGSAVVSVAAAAGTTTFRLPVGNGSSGQVLSTDGSGNLSYINAGGTGTVTSATIAAGNGISVSGTCTITTSGTCTVTNTGVIRVVQQVFTASGTYTPTSGMVYVIAECVGSGAGGGGVGGAATHNLGGGGGGSGGYSRVRLTAAAVGASQTVTVATGGAGGAAGANNGTSGGASSVGTLCIANGGAGGLAASTGQVGQGGAGALVGTGNVTARGAPGAGGIFSTVVSVALPSGMGGSSYFGGGAMGAYSGASTAGNAAGAYGSGGSGGYVSFTAANVAGGAGSDGIVVLTEFVNTP